MHNSSFQHYTTSILVIILFAETLQNIDADNNYSYDNLICSIGISINFDIRKLKNNNQKSFNNTIRTI